MTSKVLLVDFSADNSVRMALCERGQRPPPSTVFHCQTLAELDAAFGDYLALKDDPDLMGAAFSVCGWERDGAFDMPNHSYRIDRTWARERLKINRLNLVNDCVAAALAIGELTPAEVVQLGTGMAEAGQVKVMLIIGRGLGATCVIDDDLGNAIALPGGGGHSDLPVVGDREYAVFRRFATRYGHVSRTRAIGNSGVEEVYEFLGTIDGKPTAPLKIDRIAELALQGDATAREAIDMVTGWLAALAADMALINGARGGVYMSGSFFDFAGEALDRDLFVTRYTDKGRVSRHLEDIAVFQVRTAETELIGISTLFD